MWWSIYSLFCSRKHEQEAKNVDNFFFVKSKNESCWACSIFIDSLRSLSVLNQFFKPAMIQIYFKGPLHNYINLINRK